VNGKEREKLLGFMELFEVKKSKPTYTKNSHYQLEKSEHLMSKHRGII
jgi:hypothetical protein